LFPVVTKNFAVAYTRLPPDGEPKQIMPGAFVWGDSANADFASTGENQFLVRASGGVGINKNNPTPNTLVSTAAILTKGNPLSVQPEPQQQKLLYNGYGKCEPIE